MKKLLMALSLLGSTQAFAMDVDAYATRIDLNLRLYEICGTVKNAADVSGLAVDIVADPGKHEGHYVTHTNENGKFCQVVRIVGSGLKIVVNGTAKNLSL